MMNLDARNDYRCVFGNLYDVLDEAARHLTPSELLPRPILRNGHYTSVELASHSSSTGVSDVITADIIRNIVCSATSKEPLWESSVDIPIPYSASFSFD